MTENSVRTDFDEEIDRREVPALKVHPMVLGKDGEGLFAAGVADMDFKAPQVVRDAMQARLDHGVFGYEAVPEGMFPALCEWQEKRHGWALDQTHILRAPNVLNILAIAASLFTEAGDGIIVQPPVFFDFYDVVQENKRHVVENPLILRDGRYCMDFDNLEALAADPHNKMLYLCNPHNPVGRVWTRDELQQLGDICARHGVLVVSDEIHGDVTFAGHNYTPFASLGAGYAQNAIIALSPAKSFNIAACCSAFTVIADEDKRKAFQVENSRLTVNKNNSFASVAMLAAYRDGGPWLADAMTYIAGNLALLRDRLAGIDGVELIEPEGTFLAWLDFRALGMSPDELTTFLRQKAGWAVTRGQAFGKQGEGFARVNIACTRARLEKALDQLAAAIS
ncbi:MAG TPA: putative C-S lyase [Rhodobacteraceae bacterium]|nr:putative C-S lyase [Paracoccaceae bacterium]